MLNEIFYLRCDFLNFIYKTLSFKITLISSKIIAEDKLRKIEKLNLLNINTTQVITI